MVRIRALPWAANEAIAFQNFQVQGFFRRCLDWRAKGHDYQSRLLVSSISTAINNCDHDASCRVFSVATQDQRPRTCFHTVKLMSFPRQWEALR